MLYRGGPRFGDGPSTTHLGIGALVARICFEIRVSDLRGLTAEAPEQTPFCGGEVRALTRAGSRPGNVGPHGAGSAVAVREFCGRGAIPDGGNERKYLWTKQLAIEASLGAALGGGRRDSVKIRYVLTAERV